MKLASSEARKSAADANPSGRRQPSKRYGCSKLRMNLVTVLFRFDLRVHDEGVGGVGADTVHANPMVLQFGGPYSYKGANGCFPQAASAITRHAFAVGHGRSRRPCRMSLLLYRWSCHSPARRHAQKLRAGEAPFRLSKEASSRLRCAVCRLPS